MKIWIKKLFLLCLALVLLAIPTVTLLGEKSGVSFYEQRNLAGFPELSAATLLDGTFFTGLDTCLSDHIAFREEMVGLYTWLNLKLGRPVVNDFVVDAPVLLNDNGYNYFDQSYLYPLGEEAAQRYRQLQEEIQSYGGYFCYVGLPLQTYYYLEDYPSYLDDREWMIQVFRDAFGGAVEEYGVNFLDMNQEFAALDYDPIYYPQTDHHYTLEGAYLTYQRIMARIQADTGLEVQALDREELEWTTLPNPYLGSSNRQLYGLWSNTDVLEIAIPIQEIPFTRYDNGVQVESQLFALPETDTEWVTYSAYMGGDIGETVIQTNRPELPSILIYGDSFTNALETLLWSSFDEMRSLDFRYYDEMTLTEYIAQYQPDVVLCVRDESMYFTSDGNGSTD